MNEVAFRLIPALLILTFFCDGKSSAAQSETGGSNPARIERTLKDELRRDPESFDANHHLGEFYIKQGKLAAAIPYLEKAQQINPTHYTNSHDLALAYFQAEKFAHARAQIQNILKWKETAELHSLLGDVEAKAGNLVAAAEEFQRAARMDESEQNLLDLGNSLIKINAFDAAIQIFSYSLGKYPGSAKLRVGMGITRYSRGEYSDAVKLLCEAADLDPADPRPYLFLGEMYGVSPEMANEITRRMTQFVKHHPENAMAHYYYAVNLWKGQRDAGRAVDLNRIETMLRRAIALDPKLSAAHFELGVLYSEQEKYGDAINALRRTVSLQFDHAKAHYRLAQLYQRTGQKSLAARELEIHKKLNARETK
ncbi:MAG: tetratricopeptide repeat protein [Acidobacteria bacterium]|nr:tetratricopeptide repeat protein [Acidobacteriota bacterium]